MGFKVNGRNSGAFVPVSTWVVLRLGNCSKRAQRFYHTLQTLPYSDEPKCDGWRGSKNALLRAITERFGVSYYSRDYLDGTGELIDAGLLKIKRRMVEVGGAPVWRDRYFLITTKPGGMISRVYEKKSRETPRRVRGESPETGKTRESPLHSPGRLPDVPKGDSPHTREHREKRERAFPKPLSICCTKESPDGDAPPQVATLPPGGGNGKAAGEVPTSVVAGSPTTPDEVQQRRELLLAQSAAMEEK